MAYTHSVGRTTVLTLSISGHSLPRNVQGAQNNIVRGRRGHYSGRQP